MQSFARGWSFLKQTWQMTIKDRDLLQAQAAGSAPLWAVLG
ncbi:MAG: hypothetical protein ABWK53_01180 [Anaerolineales bacterium]